MKELKRNIARHRVVLFAALLHIGQGTALLIDPSAIKITALHDFDLLGHPSLVGVALITAACAAVWGVRPHSIHHMRWMAAQQILLGVSAAGAFSAIIAASFPDGTQRSQGFLLADQLPVVLIAVFHMWGLARTLPPASPQRITVSVSQPNP